MCMVPCYESAFPSKYLRQPSFLRHRRQLCQSIDSKVYRDPIARMTTISLRTAVAWWLTRGARTRRLCCPTFLPLSSHLLSLCPSASLLGPHNAGATSLARIRGAFPPCSRSRNTSPGSGSGSGDSSWHNSHVSVSVRCLHLDVGTHTALS